MITSFYAGILAIMYLFMSTNVIKGRRANKISVGHADKKGENEDLLRRVRIHANFIEYVPIALILIFLLEIEGVSSILVHILAFLLVIGRILHPLGIKTVESPGIYRIFGMVLTFFVIGIAAIANIFIYIF